MRNFEAIMRGATQIVFLAFVFVSIDKGFIFKERWARDAGPVDMLILAESLHENIIFLCGNIVFGVNFRP